MDDQQFVPDGADNDDVDVDDLMDDNHEEDPLFDEEKKGRKGKRDAGALRKAPQAPKRFKSSYICFFIAKQPSIKEELGDAATVTAISKRSAEMWKNLSSEERAHWDDVAAKDKQRYLVEKATYTGPWQVPWKRARKDPSAPKRPMSAFLYFTQGKRTEIKNKNPDMKNTEVSRILGEMWRNLSEEERHPFVERERLEREKYKIDIAEWRKESEAKQQAQQKSQAEQVPMISTFQEPQTMVYDPYSNPQFTMPAFLYPGYSYPFSPAPYQMPAPGRQPVILGPNGMPVGPANAYRGNSDQQPQAAAHQNPPQYFQQNYDEGANSVAQQGVDFDYGDPAKLDDGEI